LCFLVRIVSASRRLARSGDSDFFVFRSGEEVVQAGSQLLFELVEQAPFRTMRRLGVTSSSRTMSTAYVTLNTPSAEEKYHQPEIRTHLREVRFTDGDGEDLAEPERFYTPDLGLTYGE